MPEHFVAIGATLNLQQGTALRPVADISPVQQPDLLIDHLDTWSPAATPRPRQAVHHFDIIPQSMPPQEVTWPVGCSLGLRSAGFYHVSAQRPLSTG